MQIRYCRCITSWADFIHYSLTTYWSQSDVTFHQVHYILGSTGRSFVVGYGVNPPTHCHHRGASCYGPNRCKSLVLIFLAAVNFSAAVTPTALTPILMFSLEPWLVDRETRTTSKRFIFTVHVIFKDKSESVPYRLFFFSYRISL